MKNNKYYNNYNNYNNITLNPDFITGLSDAEGCFSIHIRRDKETSFIKNVGLEFTIKMLENETELLLMVKSFFDCGII